MKQAKRITALLLILVFICSTTTYAIDNSYVYISGNMQIVVTHSGLSENKIMQIVNLFLNESQESSTMESKGITCTLFGHQLSTSKVSITEHMVYDSYPYCICKYYDVTICERCDYTDTVFDNSERIGCCTQ